MQSFERDSLQVKRAKSMKNDTLAAPADDLLERLCGDVIPLENVVLGSSAWNNVVVIVFCFVFSYMCTVKRWPRRNWPTT